MSAPDEADNLELFRDSLSAILIAKLCPTPTKNPKKRTVKRQQNDPKTAVSAVPLEDSESNDANDLADFVAYLADEIFSGLPKDLRTISYAVVQDSTETADKYAVPLDTGIRAAIVKTLPASVPDSLCSYGLIEEPSDLERFLDPVFANYISTATAAPPEYTPALTSSRPSGCEICGREHLPLTYHHLIPREVHDKSVKRGWHKEWELNKVAWLCRACHSFVHRIATNEELARHLYDVDLLLEREDVQRFAAWVGRVRWKAR